MARRRDGREVISLMCHDRSASLIGKLALTTVAANAASDLGLENMWFTLTKDNNNGSEKWWVERCSLAD